MVFKKTRWQHKTILLAVVILVLVSTKGFLYYAFFVDVSRLKKENPGTTGFIDFRVKQWQKQGRPVRIEYIWLPITEISPEAINAVVGKEDNSFWSNKGYILKGIIRAAKRNIRSRGYKYGASTISQQLARNIYLAPQKSISRKIKEVILAWRIERELPKLRILELYLNTIEWGDGIFGIEAASRFYFFKSASDLDGEEAKKLASIIKYPLSNAALKIKYDRAGR